MSDDEPLAPEPDEDAAADRDGPDSSTDPEKLKRKTKRITAETRRQIIFWRGVLGTKQGRKEAYRLLADTGFFETMFMVSPVGFPDLEASMYKRGRHDTGMRMFFGWVKYARAQTFLMLDENDARFKPYADVTETLDD